MTSRDFCYWLQGLFELSPERKTLNAIQVELIRKHLAMVFIHEIDPSMGDKKHRAELDKAHSTKFPGGFLGPNLSDIKFNC